MVTKLPLFTLAVLSIKRYFFEIGPVHQKLCPFKCMMLKTLNSTEKTPQIIL